VPLLRMQTLADVDGLVKVGLSEFAHVINLHDEGLLAVLS